ncbi:Protein of unknown function [Cotesia congregata]|uniref:Carboxylesterase type B domain-containing protein n=1 Tax=Cotesia congregata TaxID=51543 RepID=A0A8J2H349_COTCN|nr:Protein of unknown function [Cotesia congregata]
MLRVRIDHYSKETSVVQKLFDTDLEGTALLEEAFYLFNAKILEKRGIAKPVSYPTEQIIHQRFIELWTNFAKTGNPNEETSELISVEWKPVDNSSDYNCLKISEDLCTIRVSDILHQLEEFAQKKN